MFLLSIEIKKKENFAEKIINVKEKFIEKIFPIDAIFFISLHRYISIVALYSSD